MRQRGPEVVGARSTCHGGRRAVPWIGRAAGDPGFEVGDHPVGQSHVRWHLQTVVAEGLEDQTLVDVARHDGWTGFTSTPDPVPRVECQAPFDFVRSRRVALVAVVDENRSDFGFKVGDIGGVGLVAASGRGQRERAGNQYRDAPELKSSVVSA